MGTGRPLMGFPIRTLADFFPSGAAEAEDGARPEDAGV